MITELVRARLQERRLRSNCIVFDPVLEIEEEERTAFCRTLAITRHHELKRHDVIAAIDLEQESLDPTVAAVGIGNLHLLCRVCLIRYAHLDEVILLVLALTQV